MGLEVPLVQMSVLLQAMVGACVVLAAGQVAPAPPDPSDCATTAAVRHGWGEPTRRSDFSDGLPGDWHPYGPEPGHDEKGIRTPEAITVADGVVTISATQDGTTGAMSWHPGQRYGRWEACVRSEAASGGLNALLLLWPVAEDFPVGGEIDWMEIMSDDRQETSFFLHYGPDNDQDYGSVRHDSTRPMNMTMQLDYFPPAGGPAAMHMDWAMQWALPEGEPAELSLAPGDPATGQPDDFPGSAPRRLG